MHLEHDFEYCKPISIKECIKHLSRKDALVLAGGTDLIVNIREGGVKPKVLVDIKGISELKKIDFKSNKLLLGSLVTFSDLIDSKIINKKFPSIMEVAKTVASCGVRNRATLVGNICSAVPSLDSGPMLLAYEAKVIVQGPKGKRSIKISDWFCGPRKTALKKGELVTGIAISVPDKKHGASYVKLGRYDGEDLAQASVFVMALPKNKYRIAFGAVGPVPIRSKKIEACINGKKINESIILDVKKIISKEISPITDIRATNKYREHMVKVMFERGIVAALKRLSGSGPEYGLNLV